MGLNTKGLERELKNWASSWEGKKGNVFGGGTRPAHRLPSKRGVKATLHIDGFTETIRNLGKFTDYITHTVANTMAAILIDLLSYSQPRVPLDTGELRESGWARIRFGRGEFLNIATGNKDGTVNARFNAITKARIKRSKTIRAEVIYNRLNAEGEDIAQWTHEELLPYEARPQTPAARYPDTGPKYLELAFLKRRQLYIRNMRRAIVGQGFERRLASIMQVKNRKMGNYTVDVIKLMQNKIQQTGYFNLDQI